MGKVNLHKKKMFDAGMPNKAVTKLEQYYAPGFKDIEDIKIEPDPNVEGTFAIRLTMKSKVCYHFNNEEKELSYIEDLDLLWSHDDYEECEYETWPPTSDPNNLQFNF